MYVCLPFCPSLGRRSVRQRSVGRWVGRSICLSVCLSGCVYLEQDQGTTPLGSPPIKVLATISPSGRFAVKFCESLLLKPENLRAPVPWTFARVSCRSVVTTCEGGNRAHTGQIWYLCGVTVESDVATVCWHIFTSWTQPKEKPGQFRRDQLDEV